MYKINDNNIFIGHIKQLLKNFNLPKCRVLRNDIDYSKILTKNTLYIKNNRLCVSSDSPEPTLLEKENYIYGKFYRNITTNLRLDNIIYDTYTHRYLGRYLRFLRDWGGVDLMSLYNCFDEEINNKEISFLLDPDDSNSLKKTFGGETEEHIVYSIPVLAPFSYTLGLQTRGSVEMCIGFADSDLLTPEEREYAPFLYANTYRKKNFPRSILLNDFFNSSEPDISRFYNRSDLRLLLKVPRHIRSSIVLLEGNYLKDNVVVPGSSTYDTPGLATGPVDEVTFNYNPQLLSYANTSNYLLADRLVEYLTDNVISPLSEGYDIIKLQQFLVNNYIVSVNPSVWSEKEFDTIKKLIRDEKISTNYFDSLGYCDKEVELSAQGANKIGGIV